jgi:hypothetical protein|nr:MAG TPA: hypothetical protein [Caudoviricetes sp.]
MDEKIMILYNFVVKKEDYYWEKSLRERDSQVILLDMAHLISFQTVRLYIEQLLEEDSDFNCYL